MVKSIVDLKNLDFSNMQVVPNDQGKSTMVDKDFQRAFLKL